jgi:hypothetical protein
VIGYRHGILKCVFVGVPLADVVIPADRIDAELARMMADFARERIAAKRDVPADLWPLIEQFPAVLGASGRGDERTSGVPERRAAADRALADRSTVQED